MINFNLASKTAELDCLHHGNKHDDAWKVLREITESEDFPSYSFNTAEEWQDCWFQYFSSRLAGHEPTTITDYVLFSITRFVTFFPLRLVHSSWKNSRNANLNSTTLEFLSGKPTISSSASRLLQ